MAIATVHHWHDPIAGLLEMRRVARRVVVFTYDFGGLSQFWLTRDYLPRSDGNRHRSSLARSHRWPARDAARRPPRGRVHVRLRRPEPVLADSRLPPPI